MNILDQDKPIYYVYAWYFKDSGEIFHIGKGKNNRYKDIKNHRNQYFLNIINKHRDNIDVKFLMIGLTNEESLANERFLIKYYKEFGWCKTNLHEGGYGGYTGNYQSPERSRKISVAAKKRTNEKNPMFGHHHTQEAKAKISAANRGKKLSIEHIEKLRKANTGRIKTPEELLKLSMANKGKIVSKQSIVKGIKTQSDRVFELEYGGIVFAACVGEIALAAFCQRELSISRSILSKIYSKKYVPKFHRHMWIKDLRIEPYKKTIYKHLDDYFIDTPIKVLDQKQLNFVKQVVESEKNKADILRYGTTNPIIRR